MKKLAIYENNGKLYRDYWIQGIKKWGTILEHKDNEKRYEVIYEVVTGEDEYGIIKEPFSKYFKSLKEVDEWLKKLNK